MSLRSIGIVGVAAIALLVGALVQADGGEATPGPGKPATREQVAMFEDLLRRDERITFDAMVTGDLSRFATIYYNDSSVELNVEYRAQIERVGQVATSAVAVLPDGPKGSGAGYLTARVAGAMLYRDNVAAWQTALERASAEGRQPSIADMPNGEVPYEPKTADQWIDVPFYVYDVFVDGNRATATLSYAPPEDADSAYIYRFIQIDGRWFITGLDGGHVTSRSIPKTTPYVTRSASTR